MNGNAIKFKIPVNKIEILIISLKKFFFLEILCLLEISGKNTVLTPVTKIVDFAAICCGIE